MMPGVVRQVTPLAPCAKVLGVVVLWLVIEVRDRENNPRTFVGYAVLPSPAIGVGRRPFASQPGSTKDRGANLPPVVRVTVPVFGTDRHHAAADTLRRLPGFGSSASATRPISSAVNSTGSRPSMWMDIFVSDSRSASAMLRR